MKGLVRQVARYFRRSNRFHLVSRWQVRATVEEVFETIIDAKEYIRWWDAAFLRVEESRTLTRPDGPVAEVYSKGFLPYRIRFAAHLDSQRFPETITIQARGDFEGRGRWTFEQKGDLVNIVFDWRVTVQKPLLRRLSFLLKPVFIANHRWAMAKGERGLVRELSSAN